MKVLLCLPYICPEGFRKNVFWILDKSEAMATKLKLPPASSFYGNSCVPLLIKPSYARQFGDSIWRCRTPHQEFCKAEYISPGLVMSLKHYLSAWFGVLYNSNQVLQCSSAALLYRVVQFSKMMKLRSAAPGWAGKTISMPVWLSSYPSFSTPSA